MPSIDHALRYRAKDFIQQHPSLAYEIARQIVEKTGYEILLKPTKLSVTPRQKEVLDFIAMYCDEQGGISPSFDEIKDYVGLRSKSGVHRIVMALEERGLIRRLENRARSIILTDEATAWRTHGDRHAFPPP